MKKYFLRTLKNRIPIIIALTIVFLIVAVVVNNVNPYIVEKIIDGNKVKLPREGLFLVFTIGILALSIIVPIIEFSFKMIRIQAWQIYSLPIKRNDVFLSRYFVGLIEIVIPFIVSYFVSMLLVITGDNLYNINAIYIYFPFSLIALVLMYSYFSFIYVRANNIIDGVATMVLSVAAVILVGFAIYQIVNLFQYNWNIDQDVLDEINAYYLSLTFPIDYLSKVSNDILVGNGFNLNYFEIIFAIIWVILEATLIFLQNRFNKKIKSEDITNISSSVFSYKIFLPMVCISLAIIFTITVNFWLSLIALLLTYAGYMLYTRRYDLGNKKGIFAIILVSEIVICITITILRWRLAI